MEHARLFLACDIGEEVQDRLETAVGALAPHVPGARWVRRASRHLTFRFFGTLPLDRVRGIDRAVAAAGAGETALSFELCGMGVFPSWEKPRVLWAGVGEGADEVRALGERLNDTCACEGFGEESRQFVPHVTLARITRGGASCGAKEEISSRYASARFGRVDPEELVLYSSELTPAGPEYTRVASWPLG